MTLDEGIEWITKLFGTLPIKYAEAFDIPSILAAMQAAKERITDLEGHTDPEHGMTLAQADREEDRLIVDLRAQVQTANARYIAAIRARNTGEPHAR